MGTYLLSDLQKAKGEYKITRTSDASGGIYLDNV